MHLPRSPSGDPMGGPKGLSEMELFPLQSGDKDGARMIHCRMKTSPLRSRMTGRDSTPWHITR